MSWVAPFYTTDKPPDFLDFTKISDRKTFPFLEPLARNFFSNVCFDKMLITKVAENLIR